MQLPRLEKEVVGLGGGGEGGGVTRFRACGS